MPSETVVGMLTSPVPSSASVDVLSSGPNTQQETSVPEIALRPYYNDDHGIVIYHGDCRDVSIEAPAVSSPAITITDPPYGETSLKWDAWPHGWVKNVALGSELWCFGSMRMFLETGCEFREAGYHFGQDIVWEKHNGSSFHADRFRRVHEHIVQWYRGPWNSLKRHVPTTPDAIARTIRRKERPSHFGQIGDGNYASVDGGPRLQRSVLRVRSCHGSAEHPTQKPLGVIQPLLQYSVPPGGWVFDPFCGSGSVLVAAKLHGIPAVGIEINERYCESAATRLDQGVLAFGEAQ